MPQFEISTNSTNKTTTSANYVTLPDEACTYVSAAENAQEIVQFRKTDKLTATNEVKVNPATGAIVLPDENGAYPDGVIGERDFYIAAMFSGQYTQEQLINFIIKQADEYKRFD